MAIRFQNDSHTKGQPPVWYTQKSRIYTGSYATTDWPTRTSRRVHDGLSITRNYGLDTVSDDLDSSPYSSPYYVNGRYNADNVVSQRGSSASVQGTKYLNSYGDVYTCFTKEDFEDGAMQQTSIKMWQGKQIKFELPYVGRVVGNTIAIKNTDGCTGILSIYFSTAPDAIPIYEASVDLCDVSEDKFEFFELRSIITMPAQANAWGKLYVRMEIWNEVEAKRSDNPFNTGRTIEIAATGLGNHDEASVKLTSKNKNANAEQYDYQRVPNRPLIGLIYNDLNVIPVDRVGDQKTGATVSDKGYRYDIFGVKDESSAKLIIYDKVMNKIISTPKIRLDGRTTNVQIAQVVDTDRNNWVYYVDSYSPLQRFKIGEWVSSPVQTTSGDSEVNPVLGASLLLFHNNRLYIGGFLNDKNLFQCSAITEDGPDYTSFPYRFYAPNNSPYALSTNTPTALIEYTSDRIMILGKNFYSIFTTNVNIESTASTSRSPNTPQQTSTYMDASGVASQGDVCNYKGIVYSFDPKEGIRRFTGSTWHVLENSIQSLFDRVDMEKPRKLWGFANKLYLNYTDKVDGRAKCLVWDMEMNYQQYPWFQDVDIPFCDARYDESEVIVGLHGDYPCIMELYAEDTWRRLDTPITFERHTKYLSLPGDVANMIVSRIHNEVLANTTQWWFFGITADKQNLTQTRGDDIWYRMPVWATEIKEDPVESPFNHQDVYEETALRRLTIRNIRVRGKSVQIKIKCKTFRNQASLMSTILESRVRQLD